MYLCFPNGNVAQPPVAPYQLSTSGLFTEEMLQALCTLTQDLDLQMFTQKQLLHDLSMNQFKSPFGLAAQGKPY